MNEKETYGVILELITTEFKKKLNEVKTKVDEFKEKIGPVKIKPFTEGDGIEKQVNKIAQSIQTFLNEKKIHVKFNMEGEEKDLLKASSVFDAIKYKTLVPEDAKQRIEELVRTVKDFYDIAKEGNEEVMNSFTLDKKGAEALNTELRELHKDLKGTPPLVDKVKESFNKLKETGNKFKNMKDNIKEIKENTSNFGSTVKSAFSSGISSIKRFAVGLLGVRGIYGLISKAVRSYLSEHQEVSNQLQAMFSGLGNLLAPAIEYVINLFSKLLSYVNTFIKMLTGVDLFAKGMKSVSKNTKSASKSAKELKGSLSGLDEITNIATDNGGGGSGEGGGAGVTALPTIDTGPLEKVKDFLAKIFEPFKTAWENTKEAFIGSFIGMINNLKGMFVSIGSSFFEVFTNGTGEKIIGKIILLWKQMFDIIGNVAKAIGNAWNNNKNGTKIVQSIANIFGHILDFVKLIGDSLLDWTASEGFQTALDVIIDALATVFGWIEEIATWIVEMYKKYFKPVVDDAIIPAINSIIELIGIIWEVAKPIINDAIKIIKTMLEPVIEGISTVIKGISKSLKGVAEFLIGVFTGDWKRAWNGIKTYFTGIWTSASGVVKGVINGLIAMAEGLANAFISGFNFIKKAINSIKVPNWVTSLTGIKSINLSMSNKIKLPRLEVGTPYVETGGLAYLDQGEAVIPEKFNERKYFGNDEETKDLLRELIETVENKDTSTYLDGNKIGEVAKNYINNQTRMLGRSVI